MEPEYVQSVYGALMLCGIWVTALYGQVNEWMDKK